MENFHIFELLRDLRDYLVNEARFVGDLHRRWRRRDLLARVQALLDTHDDTLAETGSGGDAPIDPHRLAAAIAELSPLARDIFMLHCRENCDYASIAARLAIPEDVVRRELAAALVVLDQALDVSRATASRPLPDADESCREGGHAHRYLAPSQPKPA